MVLGPGEVEMVAFPSQGVGKSRVQIRPTSTASGGGVKVGPQNKSPNVCDSSMRLYLSTPSLPQAATCPASFTS